MAALLGAATGCGDRATTTLSAPLPPASQGVSCGLADALHEHQLHDDATLRAAPGASVVGRLETSSAVQHAKDSGDAGSDAIAYRIDDATTLRLAVAPGAVARTRLLDASGATVAEARAGGAAVAADVTPGEYTLVLDGDDSREVHYLVQPESCSRGSGRTSALVGSAAAVNDATPGVYVQELPGAGSTIVQAATSVTAFVGAVGSGPVGQPVQLLGPPDFAANFGSAAGTSQVGRAVAQFFANGGAEAWVVGTTGTTPAELLGSGPGGGGLGALERIAGWSLLVLPDVATLSPDDATAVLASAVPLAAGRNAFTIVDPPLALGDVAAVAGWASGSLIPALPAGVRRYAAAYWPPLQVEDQSGTTVTIGAAASVAGVFAFSDAQIGVWQQPTGSIVGGTDMTISLPVRLDDAGVETLSTALVNAVWSTPQGDLVWGARTLAGVSESGGYVGSSRTDLMLRTSITDSLQWVVFEPDDATLWSSVTATVSTFLTPLWQQGAFFGATAADAFAVTCDASNNPPDQILLGLLVLDVAVALDASGTPTLQVYTFETQGPS